MLWYNDIPSNETKHIETISPKYYLTLLILLPYVKSKGHMVILGWKKMRKLVAVLYALWLNSSVRVIVAVLSMLINTMHIIERL